jgi:CheY-like chemotaxis protein
MGVTPRRVLVVDDDDDIRETLAELLRDEGYVVQEASSGVPALAVLRVSRVRLVVLLDLQMPGMDGRQVLRAVADHDALARRHACVLMTANEQALSLAFSTLLLDLQVPILAKPFGIDDVLAAVRQAERRLGPTTKRRRT